MLIRKLLWIPTYLLLIFFTFIGIMLINEWWKVGVNKDIDQYPWGIVNENPWYYETSDLYSKVSLIEGSLILFFVVMSVLHILKKNNKFNYWFLLCIFFFVLMIISSNTTEF